MERELSAVSGSELTMVDHLLQFVRLRCAKTHKSVVEDHYRYQVADTGVGLLLTFQSGGEQFPSHRSTGSNNCDEEKTVLKELVPMLACLNSSGAGVYLF